MASASAKKASTHAAAQKALLDEIKQLVDPVTGSRSKAPDAVNELHSSLHPRLVDLESFQELVHAPRPPTVDRALALSRLEDWLRVEAPQSMLGDSFQIALVGADGAQGATLVAVRDLSPGELFVRVPRSAIMSAESAMQSRFASFFARDPLCQQNLSVMLALHVVFERRDPASKWRAYLDALPDDSWGRSFLPAFVSPAQLDALAGTGVRGAAQALLRACVQQYVYLRLVLDEATKASASKPSAAENTVAPNSTDAPLTWSEWRWALSIVWSRQNRIPAAAASSASAAGDTPPAQSFCMALVPAWDFCNHSPEACATEACPLAGAAFDLELDCLECRCPPAGVRAGEAISMYYGARSSAHFLLYQGFSMDARTSNDRAPCILRIAAQGDALYKMRRLLLGQMKFSDDEAFEVAALSPQFVPVFPVVAGDAEAVELDELEESSAMAFARVAVMTKEEASARLHNPELSRFGPRNEIAAMQFIVAALEFAERQSISIGTLQSASVASELPSDSFAAVALRYRRTEQSTLRAVADSFRRTIEFMQK